MEYNIKHIGLNSEWKSTEEFMKNYLHAITTITQYS